jgi:hypothetical protein
MRRPLGVLVASFAALLPATASAQLGRTLEDVRDEDFWTHFQLQPTTPGEPVAASSEVRFRTTAARFAPRMLVTVALDGDKLIRSMEISLTREFVDDPQVGVFAADLAKSFLQAALPADDLPDMQTLVNEIWRRNAPTQATEPYLVYLGRSPSFERTLEACTVRLRSADDQLVITVAARE